MSGDLRALVEAELTVHQPRATSRYADSHHQSGHESEDERCTDACFVDGTICNGCGTQKCSEPLVDVARRLLDERDALAAKVERCEALADEYAANGAVRAAAGKPAWPNNVARDIRAALGDHP